MRGGGGTPQAASVCNGTVAVHLALAALGIGRGDEVIVPTFTYIASVNPITYLGAVPVFVDSLPDTWQMNPREVESKITGKTRAIIAVHIYGHPCDMRSITETARKHGLFLVEDCAEAIGSRCMEKSVGCFGDVAAFSFFANKTVTCGEGGMVVARDSVLFERLVRMKGQGLASGREYWHDIIGFNYRMTNVAAAIGFAQMERIDGFVEKKSEIARWYIDGLEGSRFVFHKQTDGVRHSYWMCSMLAESREMRDAVREHLKLNGIETRPMFPPVHTMPMYGPRSMSFPVAEDLAARGFNVPSYPDLNRDDLGFICEKIREAERKTHSRRRSYH
ncbi:MAG: DegT/DnrJ/EryC1/StrS family aminotransferase [Synergistaceae bacterium]|nr:DegT/DnrJ/EryC1/StrS family aminotransferase [Synergistaceae bacterium]